MIICHNTSSSSRLLNENVVKVSKSRTDQKTVRFIYAAFIAVNTEYDSLFNPMMQTLFGEFLRTERLHYLSQNNENNA